MDVDAVRAVEEVADELGIQRLGEHNALFGPFDATRGRRQPDRLGLSEVNLGSSAPISAPAVLRFDPRRL